MIVLVTGGASCGKSAFAEDVCMALSGKLVYLAAMRPFGEEGRRRVRKHQQQRAGKGFETIECYEAFDALLQDARLEGATALLESLGNVVANVMFDAESAQEEPEEALAGGGAEHAAGTLEHSTTGGFADKIVRTIDGLAAKCDNLVIVGDEVGADGIAYAPETHAYQMELGALLCKLAESCDLVVECASGVPSVLKWTRTRDTAREVCELLGLTS